MRKIYNLTAIGIKQYLKDPLYMMSFVGIPILMTWLMSFLPVQMAGLAASGVMVMFIGINLITSAGSILEERHSGTWGRLLATPTTRLEIILGFLIKLFIMSWIQALVLLLAGKYLFGAPWSFAFLKIVCILTAYISAMTGLGLMLAGFLKSSQQVQIFATGIVMVGSMLSGAFIPVTSHSPAVMVMISRISPQGWAARALNDIMAHGAGLASVTGPVIWLLGLGCAFLIVGLYRIKFE
jgi:ABC-2 type transport system permease protein